MCFAAAAEFPSAFLRRRWPATGLDFGLGRRTPSGRRRRRLARPAHRLFHFRRPPARFRRRRFLGRFTAPVDPSRVAVVQHHVHGRLRRSACRQQFYRRPLHRVVGRVSFFSRALYDRNVRPPRRENNFFKNENKPPCLYGMGGEGVLAWKRFLCFTRGQHTDGVGRNDNISYKTERPFSVILLHDHFVDY